MGDAIIEEKEVQVDSASLGDILSNKALEEVADIDTDEETPPEETPGEETPPDGETPVDPPEETPPEEVPPEDSDEVKGLKARLHDEKVKRQAAQAKLDAADPAEEKSFWEDPEGKISQASKNVENKLLTTVLTISENAARARHEDFDSKADAFTAAAKENPTLIDRMLKEPDPAEFVYKTGEKELLLTEMGDPKEFKEKLTAEITTKLKEKYDKQLKDEIAKLAKLKKSPGEVKGDGHNYHDNEEKVEDTPLDKI